MNQATCGNKIQLVGALVAFTAWSQRDAKQGLKIHALLVRAFSGGHGNSENSESSKIRDTT